MAIGINALGSLVEAFLLPVVSRRSFSYQTKSSVSLESDANDWVFDIGFFQHLGVIISAPKREYLVK